MGRKPEVDTLYRLSFLQLQQPICCSLYARYQVRREGCAFRLQQLGLRILMRSTFSLQINERELKFFQFSEDNGLCKVLIKSLSDCSSSCDAGLCTLRMCQGKKTNIGSSVASEIWEATRLMWILGDMWFLNISSNQFLFCLLLWTTYVKIKWAMTTCCLPVRWIVCVQM